MPQPPDTVAHQLMLAGRFAEAVPHAQHAVAGAKRALAAHGLLASILLQMGRSADAQRALDTALALPAGDADAHDALAFVAMHLGHHALANDLYRKAAALAPRDPRHLYNLASSERGFGRLEAAEALCSRAIDADGDHLQSYLLRAELRVQTPRENHVAQLRQRLAGAPRDYRTRIFLGYALGKELDDLGEYDAAFAEFAQAAAARRAQLAYDVAGDEHKLRRIAEVYGTSHAAGAEIDSSQCIFIVGLPRSGTTLLERVLTGLPGVRSNGETDHFTRALLAATPAGREDVFSRAARAEPNVVAQNYLASARIVTGQGRVIEKLPMNYLYLGAIHRALPRAALIWVTRSPIDSGFAMFRTLFGDAYPFSYDFEDLARYYAAYLKLMNHWRGTLGDALIEVPYEAFVADPHRSGAMLASRLGLTWQSEALDLQRNSAVSLTASAAQIRRPIYGTSSGKWRHYRAHLAGFIRSLHDRGVEVPTDA